MRSYCAVPSSTLSPAIITIPSKFIISTHRNLNPLLNVTRQLKGCCCSTSLTHSNPSRPREAEKKKNRRREPKSCNEDDDNGDFVVVNFYKFVFVKNPEEEVAKHLSFLEDLNIHGRVYLNEQGINAQYSGPSKDALAYVEWLREDERFSDVLVQMSPARNGHAFPKLKLRYKPSLVQASYLEGGISHLPLLDLSMRATPLSPSEWRKKLEAVKKIDESSNSNLNTDCILLDVRNVLYYRICGSLALELHPISMDLRISNGCSVSLGYEWDIGHFHGARRPDVDCFRSTSFGLSQREAIASDPLANVDKEKADVLMYCTGGIRCDVYSTILRQRGFKNLYTLKGGVSHYLENEGTVEWVGNLFVFDSRLSLPPSIYKPEAVTEANIIKQVSENPFATCYICGTQVRELRHRNCANIDCNLLFLIYADVVVQIAPPPLDLDPFFLDIKDTKNGTYIAIWKCKRS
ncbi:hypothetical protein JRO89_XS13G0238800 [Xanthoceras sorbifolium]|uniref:Rhodanese domain-containing protein n=1 Tax=Xanthoceras sorbifolium TaxID=99658 RepID=A0ABQ8H9R7_9ROSI|nr:hypothetical protein JRO89_XS13G0238800 [Xanthoceras sorbifolium]